VLSSATVKGSEIIVSFYHRNKEKGSVIALIFTTITIITDID